LIGLHNVKAKVRKTDAFMSSTDLKNLFRMELSMVEVIKKQKVQLEQSLREIHTYVTEVEELYKGENCSGNNCDDDILLEKVVGNPIYNYQMLKRLLVYWKNMEDSVKKIDTKVALADLKKIKHRHGGMPTDRDLQGAAKALIRLRSTFKMDLQQFSSGNILGLTTKAALKTKDSFFLGRFAYMNGHLAEAEKWLDLAASQVASEMKHSNQSSVNVNQLDQMLIHLREEIDKSDLVEDQDEDISTFQLGVIPPKTQDRDKMITANDHRNFAALCRGVPLLPRSISKNLQCYYTTQGDPYFLYQPLKMEVHHPRPHLVVSFHGVLSPKEADGLVATAQPRMQQASIGHGKEVSEMRVSRNCWIKDFESKLVDKLSPRINWITRLQTSRPLDLHHEGQEEEYEQLQIANYGIGGHYQSHQDPMFVYKDPEFLVYSVENKNGRPPYVTGDRLATFMLYLSEVPLGGWTAFPRLGVAIAPSKGSAVFWYNLKTSGKSDMAMLHGGCPVVLGSKWVANKWIRENANMFHSPCGSHIDV